MKHFGRRLTPQTSAVRIIILLSEKIERLQIFLHSGLKFLSSPMWSMRLILAFLVFTFCHAVDRSKFRTCSETGFCRRYRDHSAARDGHNVSSNTSSTSEILSPKFEIYLPQQLFVVRPGYFYPCAGCWNLGRQSERIVS